VFISWGPSLQSLWFLPVVLMILHERWIVRNVNFSIVSINIGRFVLLEDMINSLFLQTKLLGSSELPCAEGYMKDRVTEGSAVSSVRLLLLFFNLPISVASYS